MVIVLNFMFHSCFRIARSLHFRSIAPCHAYGVDSRVHDFTKNVFTDVFPTVINRSCTLR